MQPRILRLGLGMTVKGLVQRPIFMNFWYWTLEVLHNYKNRHCLDGQHFDAGS